MAGIVAKSREKVDVPPRDGLAKISEVQDYLRCSRMKVYAEMERGNLPYCKLGKSRRIRWADVFDMVERGMVRR